MGNGGFYISSVIAWIIVLAVYFVPWIVAYARGHRNTTAIAVLNIFAGWTFVGWLIALVWACTTTTRVAPTTYPTQTTTERTLEPQQDEALIQQLRAQAQHR